MNELLLEFARWLDTFQSSTRLHESYYMYNWIEATHVLTLMVFLGMLCIVDLRMLGVAFTNVPASKVAQRLDIPMLLGFVVMVITGLLLFYAIPVRTTQSIWFRLKMVLFVAAGVNALLFRNVMHGSAGSWDEDAVPPRRIRIGAGLSLTLWTGVVSTGRLIAYDWYDCHQELARLMYWAAGCINELAALEDQG